MASVPTLPAEPEAKLAVSAHRTLGLLGSLTLFWLVRVPKVLVAWVPQFADALVDGAWTSAWRGMAGIIPLIGLALGFLTPLLSPGTVHLYSDSPLFLAIVVAGAILSGPVGLTLLAGYTA